MDNTLEYFHIHVGMELELKLTHSLGSDHLIFMGGGGGGVAGRYFRAWIFFSLETRSCLFICI